MANSIDLDTATELIGAAKQQAEQMGLAMVVAVANPEGNLIAQHRMDGAWLASVSISKNKAYTAAALQMPTHELAEPTQPGQPLYGLETMDKGRLVNFGGGFPLKRDGTIVGTIGASGGQPDEDMQVARAGVEQFS